MSRKGFQWVAQEGSPLFMWSESQEQALGSQKVEALSCEDSALQSPPPWFLSPLQPGSLNDLEQNEENLVTRDVWESPPRPEFTTVSVNTSLASVG